MRQNPASQASKHKFRPQKIYLVEKNENLENKMAMIQNQLNRRNIQFEEEIGFTKIKQLILDEQNKNIVIINNEEIRDRDIPSQIIQRPPFLDIYCYPLQSKKFKTLKNIGQLLKKIQPTKTIKIKQKNKRIQMKSMKRGVTKSPDGQILDSYKRVLIYGAFESSQNFQRLKKAIISEPVAIQIRDLNDLISLRGKKSLLMTEISNAPEIGRFLENNDLQRKIDLAILGVRKGVGLQRGNVKIITQKPIQIIQYIEEAGIDAKHIYYKFNAHKNVRSNNKILSGTSHKSSKYLNSSRQKLSRAESNSETSIQNIVTNGASATNIKSSSHSISKIMSEFGKNKNKNQGLNYRNSHRNQLIKESKSSIKPLLSMIKAGQINKQVIKDKQSQIQPTRNNQLSQSNAQNRDIEMNQIEKTDPNITSSFPASQHIRLGQITLQDISQQHFLIDFNPNNYNIEQRQQNGQKQQTQQNSISVSLQLNEIQNKQEVGKKKEEHIQKVEEEQREIQQEGLFLEKRDISIDRNKIPENKIEKEKQESQKIEEKEDHQNYFIRENTQNKMREEYSLAKKYLRFHQHSQEQLQNNHMESDYVQHKTKSIAYQQIPLRKQVPINNKDFQNNIKQQTQQSIKVERFPNLLQNQSNSQIGSKKSQTIEKPTIKYVGMSQLLNKNRESAVTINRGEEDRLKTNRIYNSSSSLNKYIDNRYISQPKIYHQPKRIVQPSNLIQNNYQPKRIYHGLQNSQVWTEDEGNSQGRSCEVKNSYIWQNRKNVSKQLDNAPKIIGNNRINLDEYDKTIDERGRVVYKKKGSYSLGKSNNSILNNNSISNKSIASNSNRLFCSKVSQISKQSDDGPQESYNIRKSNIYSPKTIIRKENNENMEPKIRRVQSPQYSHRYQAQKLVHYNYPIIRIKDIESNPGIQAYSPQFYQNNRNYNQRSSQIHQVRPDIKRSTYKPPHQIIRSPRIISRIGSDNNNSSLYTQSIQSSRTNNRNPYTSIGTLPLNSPKQSSFEEVGEQNVQKQKIRKSSLKMEITESIIPEPEIKMRYSAKKQPLYIHGKHVGLDLKLEEDYPNRYEINFFHEIDEVPKKRDAIVMLHPEMDNLAQNLPIQQFETVYMLGKTSKVPNGAIRIDHNDLQFLL